ncbi:MAG: hypothetical protein ACKO7W_09750 [Elainella sp.]
MPSQSLNRASASGAADQRLWGQEFTQFHTRILRVSLAIEESRAYWEHLKLDTPREKRAEGAFEERWFGSKSMDRVRRLLAEFSHRYDAYPVALQVLTQWRPSDAVTRQNICHWHMQLADPTYRAFTGVFLEQRRLQPGAGIDRDGVARWVSQQLKVEWSSATTQRMAAGLIASATDAGLCSENAGTRSLRYPKVTDEALAYWLYLLRNLSFEGTILDNPYLASVGLSEGFLEQRLRRLPGLSFNRMNDLHEFNWQYPSLKTWAVEELGLTWKAEGEDQL